MIGLIQKCFHFVKWCNWWKLNNLGLNLWSQPQQNWLIRLCFSLSVDGKLKSACADSDVSISVFKLSDLAVRGRPAVGVGDLCLRSRSTFSLSDVLKDEPAPPSSTCVFDFVWKLWLWKRAPLFPPHSVTHGSAFALTFVPEDADVFPACSTLLFSIVMLCCVKPSRLWNFYLRASKTWRPLKSKNLLET